MSSRASQRTVYLVTAAIVASMVGGFALATMSLGGVNNSYQGSQTTTVAPMQGLSYVSTQVVAVQGAGGSSIPSPCTPLASVCDVTSGTGLAICAGSYSGSACVAGDFVEQVTLTTVANTAFPVISPNAVAVTLYVTGTPNSGASSGIQGTYTGSTFYFSETAAPTVAQTLTFDFDIGVIPTGPGGVTSISVLVTTVP